MRCESIGTPGLTVDAQIGLIWLSGLAVTVAALNQLSVRPLQ